MDDNDDEGQGGEAQEDADEELIINKNITEDVFADICTQTNTVYLLEYISRKLRPQKFQQPFVLLTENKILSS